MKKTASTLEAVFFIRFRQGEREKEIVFVLYAQKQECVICHYIQSYKQKCESSCKHKGNVIASRHRNGNVTNNDTENDTGQIFCLVCG